MNLDHHSFMLSALENTRKPSAVDIQQNHITQQKSAFSICWAISCANHLFSLFVCVWSIELLIFHDKFQKYDIVLELSLFQRTMTHSVLCWQVYQIHATIFAVWSMTCGLHVIGNWLLFHFMAKLLHVFVQTHWCHMWTTRTLIAVYINVVIERRLKVCPICVF